MTWAPDSGSNTWYTVQPGEYGGIGPFGYGSHPGEYGVDTAHGVVPIVIGQAYQTSQFLSRTPPRITYARPSRPRRSPLRALARLFGGVLLAIVVTAVVELATYPLAHDGHGASRPHPSHATQLRR